MIEAHDQIVGRAVAVQSYFVLIPNLIGEGRLLPELGAMVNLP